MDQKLIDLYDEFTHGNMGRRTFLKRLAGLAGGVAAAYALLPLLENNYALAQTVSADDDRITTSWVTWAGGQGEVRGYLVSPVAATGTVPGVVVIHENRGLNPHIMDVARRVALAGFVALAPDGLSTLGGTPADEDAARGLFSQLDREVSLADFVGGVDFLHAHDGTTGRIGCVGFCWGGLMANRLAVASERMAAAVPFYGMQAPLEDVPRIRGALQIHYAENDARINAGIADYMQALQDARITFEQYIYPGTQHAFHNDTNGARYDADAAALAWERTIEFFRKHLT